MYQRSLAVFLSLLALPNTILASSHQSFHRRSLPTGLLRPRQTTCDPGYVECDGFCIYATDVCCYEGTGGSCSSGDYCTTDDNGDPACCEVGEICYGNITYTTTPTAGVDLGSTITSLQAGTEMGTGYVATLTNSLSEALSSDLESLSSYLETADVSLTASPTATDDGSLSSAVASLSSITAGAASSASSRVASASSVASSSISAASASAPSSSALTSEGGVVVPFGVGAGWVKGFVVALDALVVGGILIF